MNDNLFPQIPKATLKELLFWLIGKRKRFRVTGNSMLPTLQQGDIVLLSKKFDTIQIGDIIVFSHPKTNKKIIKRLQKKEGNKLFLEGDNLKESTDSREFGWIDQKDILGIAKSVINK